MALHLPAHADPYLCISGIDPGSDTLGLSFITYDIRTCEIVSITADTLFGAKAGRGTWETMIHGDRWGRITALHDILISRFWVFRPAYIFAESPFIHPKHPQAGLALTEVMAMIRRAVMQYDPWQSLRTIDPATVKKTLGVHTSKGGETGKADMKTCVAKIIQNYHGHKSFDELDEHSIDAIAVGHTGILTHKEEICHPSKRA